MYLFYLILLFAAELAYFKIANHYNIIDKPNHRSSHSEITIRGGGIIFPLSVLLWFVGTGFQYPLFISGLIIISTISFIDDIREFPKRWRLLAHLAAIVMVFWQLNLFSANWMLLAAFIIIVGVINAYNFMDGINGITGIYSLVTLSTLLYINQYQVIFINTGLILSAIIGIIVFNFFNFRKKAVCFAGDVGSISIAFIICFLLIKLMLTTGNISYVLILAVYGIDTAFTMILRLTNGENIFLAHRAHLYQLLVNERGFKHLTVAIIYGFIQLLINLNLLITGRFNSYIFLGGFLIILSIIYLVLRYWVNNRQLYKTKPF